MALPNEPGNRFISIHALREEGDVKGWLRATEVTRFLSTPSARRATGLLCLLGSGGGISIHALREEGDKKPLDGDIIGVSFLSTPSARRATTCAVA